MSNAVIMVTQKTKPRTRSIEIPPRCNIVHGATYGQQDPPTIFPIERLQRLGIICLEEYSGRVRFRHP